MDSKSSCRRTSCLCRTAGLLCAATLTGTTRIGRRRLCIRDSAQGKPHIINQLFKRPIDGLVTTDHNVIPTGQCEFSHQLLCHSTQTPPNAIADDGLSHLFGDSKAYSYEQVFTGVFCIRFDPRAWCALQDQSLCNPFSAGARNTEEFRTLFKAFHRNGHNIRPTDACGPWRGVR